MPRALTKRIAKLAAAGALALASHSALALVAELDTFTIVKNGSILFQDTFDDNVAPPAAPGEFATYLFPLGTITESNGKAYLNAAQGALRANAAGALSSVTRATFSTNIVSSEDTGLKSNQTFSVSATYGFLDVMSASDTYGIRLTDRDALGNFGVGSSGDDVIELRISRSDTNATRLQLRRQNFIAGQIDIVANFNATALLTNFENVELKLSKDAVNSNAIKASATFMDLDGLLENQIVNFETTTNAFHGENWTRAEIFASQAPIPEPQTYAMLLTGLALVGWQLQRKSRQGRKTALC